MDLSYQIEKLNRRLEGLQREKDIYQHSLDNVGKTVVKIDLMKKFGYYSYASNSDNFDSTRLFKYIERTTVKMLKVRSGRGVRKIYHRKFRDLIWLPIKVADAHMIRTISSRNPKWGYRLCLRDTVPFWLLKKYGGPYSGLEFIDEVNHRITATKKRIECLSQIEEL